jgi:ABC-type uncharacterized transport system substrate-binding protein
MALVLDPVATGLVKSVAHPGGNVTGLSMMAMELYPKRLQLLKEIIPQLTRVAVFWNPDHPFHAKAVEEVKAVDFLRSLFSRSRNSVNLADG